MAALTVICFFAHHRSTTLRHRMSVKRLLCEAAGNSSFPLYQYRDIQRATDNFSERQRLGTRAYGTVYAGKLHNDEWVAIKKIGMTHGGQELDFIHDLVNAVRISWVAALSGANRSLFYPQHGSESSLPGGLNFREELL